MSSSKTYFAAQQWARERLADGEVDPQAPQFLLKERHGWDDTHLLLHNRELMPAAEWQWFQKAINRLQNSEPAQYIVGSAPFYGRHFMVNQDVLIPESETTELVDWVLNTMPTDSLKVLDLGAGSGVIGITLALERPEWDVTLSDISAAALKVAQKNVQHFGLDLKLVKSDLFANLADEKYDLIVTNPPYIAPNATDVMDRAVIKFEPDLALFADENGLGFYHRLFKTIADHLRAQGQLFGETGFDQEESIQELLHRVDSGAQIEPRHDIAGKMRMIHAWDFSNAGGK
ncbi:MAG: peptide chain release factor N(5)-glutamine methyltransferase [Limosilactobacillus sp.]|jgi:release factor glutamine methyltransferase|uniref:peptide chain release factor N(5)-glutamine methyltransferase n=1 Tax=Limosilactobacillus sp. TaxID=2773925 RepID=UPI0025B7BEF0|nr:peptide chain release factor N(5)-glutamine methyltransferase [Limosilactobacillus sp.]MCI1975203.1 peptide chain release factor N(5)-glutamine methyltransferase [Limosilactobacillus sp.]MCI2031162.1 peptide chain release factor N(5)-glutamine methyltransferase [Limosilactobacillus sp.]